ncbi:MAG TPA: (2Fe-2S)-binding protein [Patescibacteria group bacterium]|nr:(2Fe-2S)-binding protein [Patescibacteria group bacterium]
MPIELNVNGKNYSVDTSPDTSLLTVLRDHLELTGSKYGCGEAECGACTVIVDGDFRRSCVTAVAEVRGKPVTTIEGLERDGKLHPVQQAFLDAEAFQCAYCTPGFIMTTVALLRSNPHPTDEQIAQFLEGNICRCGTYPRILEAVRRAARAMASGGAR